MRIKNIKIKNFRSLYGEHYFDFEQLEGLVKLSGVVGSGKTSLGDAILWGLYGKIKEHKNPNLASWHVKSNECEIEINLISKNKEINIKRNLALPLEITVNGKLLSASNKRDTQQILEEEFLDVPSLAIQKMCIISFNAFKNSLCAMSAGETRQFLDEIFGFKTFTEYNNEIVYERKQQLTENTQLNTILTETRNQIDNLHSKKTEQHENLTNSIDVEGLEAKRKELVDKGVSLKGKLQAIQEEHKNKVTELQDNKKVYYDKKMEFVALGKQAREWVKKFGEGKCPTCGHSIEPSIIDEYKNKLDEYTVKYRELDAEEKKFIKLIEDATNETITVEDSIKSEMDGLRKEISEIDSQIRVYKSSVELLKENYDTLISELEEKASEIEEKISVSDKHIGEWNDMNELFSKTLRYGLLDTLIPHINHSIKYYMNQLEQEYTVNYDQEFKPHIFIDGNEKEISYSDLSTGQKKTLDIAVIFGVIQNVIANVDFNIFFLDELFSNLDSDSRNIMLTLLSDTLKDNRTIFVVNHAEMQDDYFEHKIRVHRENKKIIEKKEEIIVKTSKYEQIF